MTTRRYFSGGRSPEQQLKRLEMIRFYMQTKGKLSASERNKRLLKKMMDERRKSSGIDKVKPGFSLPKTLKEVRLKSKAQEYMERQVEEKRKKKETKELKRMVVVRSASFNNGRIDKNGQIYDVQGNLIGQVNKKNGAITTVGGMYIGRYDPKSFLTAGMIQAAILKFSPYFIKLRLMQMQEQSTVWGNNDSVERTNAWGVAADNVWGGMNSNVWGTASGGSVWGQMGSFWGTITLDSFRGIGTKISNFFRSLT